VLLLLALVAGLAPGCTLFSDSLVPKQPQGEVTVVGAINIDGTTLGREGCSAGRALLWGIARNTGDVDVDDVFIEIDALGANNVVLDTYRVNVFNGEQTEVPSDGSETTIQVAGTSLTVDQSGSFHVCTRLAPGAVTGTAYRTDFIVVNELLL
jgi:hypothetical protein